MSKGKGRAQSERKEEAGRQRARILQRAGGKCEKCGSLPDWRGLQVHHVKVKGMGGTRKVYDDSELLALCGRCHSTAHGIREG